MRYIYIKILIIIIIIIIIFIFIIIIINFYLFYLKLWKSLFEKAIKETKPAGLVSYMNKVKLLIINIINIIL